MTTASNRRDVLADLQAEADKNAAAKAGERAVYIVSDSVAAAVRPEDLAGGDVEAFAVRLARSILPALVADGWFNPGLKPVDAILFCPACGTQHVDAPSEGWTNPPHRSHLCHACGHVWRPADVATNGVLSIATAGGADDKPIVSGLTLPARKTNDRA